MGILQHFLLYVSQIRMFAYSTDLLGPCCWFPKQELFFAASPTLLSSDFQSMGEGTTTHQLLLFCGSY